MEGVREDEERDGHTADASVEKGFSADFVDERESDDGCEDVDDGDEEGGENRVLVGGDSGECEDLRPIVDDCVNSGDLLEHRETDGNVEGATHGGGPESTPSALHFGLQAGANVFEQESSACFISISFEYGFCILRTILREEPARAF